MRRSLPSYLRTHRRSWALTQRELGELLGGVDASAISKFESATRVPNLEIMLGLEIVFDEPARALVPALSRHISQGVRLKAVALKERLAKRNDARSIRKRRLLEVLITRLSDINEKYEP